jgi:hypothetical protein
MELCTNAILSEVAKLAFDISDAINASNSAMQAWSWK